MLRITLNNGKSTMSGDRILIHELRELYKLRIKNSFFNPLVRQGRWDGYVRYISEVNGMFSTGLLHEIIALLDEQEVEYEIEDRRTPFKPMGVPDVLPNGDKLRDDQKEVVEAVLNHRILGIRFTRGMVDAATNYGKSYVIAGIFCSYHDKRTGVLLIDSKEIFLQLVTDLKRILGEDQVGEISTRKVDIKRFNVGMVQTIKARINKDPRIKRFLNNCDICLVDEADLGTSEAHKVCYRECANAPVRVGLTGTAETEKDKVKQREIFSFFGPIIKRVTNLENVEAGVSTRPEFRIFNGNKRNFRGAEWGYGGEGGTYDVGIVKNSRRNKKIWKRVNKNLKRKRFPILIMCRVKEHAVNLMDVIPPELLDKYKVAYVFHDTPGRTQVIQLFKEGLIDILIAGFFLKRGINMPLIKCLINAAGGDSEKNVLQILGRLIRKHESKDKVYMEDFMDQGKHLSRHSKHRINYYKKQGFEVKEYWKKGTIKK